MASPVNIRVSAPFPFPALVRGASPIVVSKANGIWTVSFEMADLTVHVPSIADLSEEYWLVYDAVRQTFFRVPLSTLGIAGSLAQRLAIASPIVVSNNDQIINFNINAPATCTLPSYATRSGAPLTFKDVGGHLSGTNTLTITPAGGETIDGQPNIVLNSPYQRLTLIPANDGTSTGWGT